VEITPDASTYTTARPVRLSTKQRRAVIAASVGNTVEYLDWVIYSSLVSVFSQYFFPAHNEVEDLLSALAVFAVGFGARPVGAYFLGLYADRNGRRKALVLSITITSIASLAIGVVPSYSVVGVLAPVVLVVARLASGFSTGGEASASLTFMAEIAPPQRRGFIGSFQQVSTGVGILLGSLVSTVLLSVMSTSAMDQWGWRLAFAFAAVLGFFGLYLRTKVAETSVFVKADDENYIEAKPGFTDLFKTRSRKAMILVFVLTVPATITNYIWQNYMPTFAHVVTGIPLKTALLANSIALVFSCCVIPLCGYLSDRWGRKPNFYIFTIGYMIFGWPAIHFLTDSFASVLIIDMLGVLLLAFDSAIIAAAYNELFSTRIRATAVAMPYAVSIALFGGTAPYLTTWMFAHGLFQWMWLYIVLSGLVGLIATVFLPETFRRDLRQI
jgi:MHS family alpha-ketoglutarate permease-like MFS transporter